MKVLHLIQRYPPAVGGSELWCREVCQYLADTGDDVKVLTLNIVEEEEFWRDPPFEKCTLRLGKLDWDGKVLVRRYRRSLPIHTFYHLVLKHLLDRLFKIYFYGPHSAEMYTQLFVEVKAADVVHLHTMPYPHNFIGYLAARRFRKRVVITPHFHPGHPYYERRSNYWLLKRCDAVITVSEYERNYLIAKGIDADKLVVTGNGVHIDQYLPKNLGSFTSEIRRRHRLSEGTKLILFIGRKLEYKGIGTLVEAFRRLADKHDVALFLVGPSSAWFDDFYQGLTESERERIIDLGAVSHDEKVNLLHLSDVLVLPSQFEAFGIVFLEAWACGTPVIGSAIGPIPDIIGQGGLTFELGNPDDLARSIEALIQDPTRAHAMAIDGREKVRQQYSWRAIGQTVRQTYRPQLHGRKRILICSSLFPPYFIGGAELVAYHQAKMLKALGHEVQVFCGRLGAIPRRPYRVQCEKDEFYKTRIHLSYMDISGDRWNFRNQRVGEAFAKVLEDFSPHVVHFHNLVGLSVKLIDECRMRGIPTVLTLHDYWGICFKNTMMKNDGSLCLHGGFDCLGCREMLLGEPPLPSPVRNAHVQLSLGKVNRFISPSHYLAERYAANGIPREKISIIKYGIELERFRAVARPRPRLMLGYIGHLGKHKGLQVLLRALPYLDLDRLHLLVVGDGDEAESLRALCRELHLESAVTFYGRVDNQRIAAIHEQIDVLIVPSIWPDNSPVTIAEAMASSIPVIASDIGGIGELVDDGVTGFLVPPGDVPALRDRIQRLLDHPELVQEMGDKGLAKIQQYSLRNQVIRIAEIYQEVMDQRTTPSAPDADVLIYDSDPRWNMQIREMFHQLAATEKKLKRRLLICGATLADEDAYAMAKLCLIPSPGQNSLRLALRALQRQIPLVVGAEAWELKELCLASNAGLFYATPEELGECVDLLLSDESLRQAMGVNGKKFIELSGSPALLRRKSASNIVG